MFSIFKKNPIFSKYKVDFHSHLIPGIDDGVKDLEESIEIIRFFKDLGYKKIITTPHIHSEYYPNTEADILEQYELLRNRLDKENLEIQLSVAAEYYADDQFRFRVKQDHKFLTFGENYILIETSFINKPVFLNDLVFELHSKGFKVILAHPERYLYLHDNLDELDKLKQQGVFLQLNLGSLSGMYSREVRKFAERLIDDKKIDFVGSDCHNSYQLEFISKSIQRNSYKKLSKLPILNDTLL